MKTWGRSISPHTHHIHRDKHAIMEAMRVNRSDFSVTIRYSNFARFAKRRHINANMLGIRVLGDC